MRRSLAAGPSRQAQRAFHADPTTWGPQGAPLPRHPPERYQRTHPRTPRGYAPPMSAPLKPPLSRALGLLPEDVMGPVRRVPQDGHFGDRRDHFLDQRQPLYDKPHSEVRHACDVPTRPRETSDEPSTNGIPNRGHHDGDRAGRLFGGENHRLLCRHDDGDLEPDQFSCEIGKSIEPSSSPALLDRDIVSLDI